MSSFPNMGLLILRCTFAGLMFINHGLEKLMKFEALTQTFPNPIGLGSGLSAFLIVFAEAGMAFFVFIGLFTRLACIPLVFAMGVAAFVVHSADPLKTKEMALLYLSAFSTIMLLGPGTFSLDAKLRRKL